MDARARSAPRRAVAARARRRGCARALARRAAALAAVALSTGSVAGCATILQGADIGPDGRSRTDNRLRQMLAAGHADSALAWLNAEPERLPGDGVLDHLYFGALAHHAGRFEESSLWLRSAYELAEDRYSKSVFRSALSLVANDRVLPYEPGETERLLIHYYNAKNHLALADRDGAAVEARRLTLLLDRYDDESAPTRLRGAFRAFASAVFAAAGEWNDADVAARKAAEQGASWRADIAWSDPPADDAYDFVTVPLEDIVAGPPTALWTGAGPAHGWLVVVVEHGRIAQRVEESALLALDDRDRDRLHGGGRRRVYASMDLARRLAPDATADPDFLAALALAEEDAAREEAEDEPDQQDAAIRGDDPETDADDAERGADPVPGDGPRPPAAPALEPAGEAPAVPASASDTAAAAATDHGHRHRSEPYDPNPYVMRIAWASYRRSPGARTPARSALRVDGEPGEGARLDLDLSAGVMADYGRDLAWALARAVARAGVKLAITRAVETEAGEKNEAVGRILGAVANAGALLSERADLRSWALVPDRLELLRLELPAGDHRITLASPSGEPHDLGPVTIVPGRTRVLFVDADRGSP